jgi:integrase/recombinase XerD
MVRVVWAMIEQRRRLYLVDETCSFVAPVKHYLDYLSALEKSPHTLENYCRHLQHFFAFLEEVHLDWHDVTTDHLVQFVQRLRNPYQHTGIQYIQGESQLSERSVNTILAAVTSFYRYHLQRGEILTSPIVYEQISNRFSRFKPFLVHTSRGKMTKHTLKLKEPKKKVTTLSDADFERFLTSTNNLQFRCILFLLRGGGLRIGEVLGLLIQDIEFHRNGLWIRRRQDLGNGALAKGMQEGEERFVDLDPQVMMLLDTLLLQHTFDTDHVFVVLKKDARDQMGRPTYGQPLNGEAVKASFRHYSQKSGVPLHAHLLRHTHATELIRAGWDASYVQQRLGHANVQTTINTYVHLNEDDLSQKWREYQERKNKPIES